MKRLSVSRPATSFFIAVDRLFRNFDILFLIRLHDCSRRERGPMTHPALHRLALLGVAHTGAAVYVSGFPGQSNCNGYVPRCFNDDETRLACDCAMRVLLFRGQSGSVSSRCQLNTLRCVSKPIGSPSQLLAPVWHPLFCSAVETGNVFHSPATNSRLWRGAGARTKSKPHFILVPSYPGVEDMKMILRDE
jgi:hypothetical protein